MRATILAFGIICIFTAAVFAQGNLTPPPGAPAPTMKSLQEIWDKIDTLQTSVSAQQQKITLLERQNNLLLESTGVLLAWQVTTVDTAGSVGTYSSLAFQPNGQPAISYYEASNRDLKYAAYDGAAWVTNIVDSDGGVGQYSSLAFSHAGQAAISYYDATNQSLKYAVLNSGSWQITTVDSGNVGQHTSLAFSPSGQPAIAYYDQGKTDLKFAAYNGTNWQLTTIDTNSNAGQYASLAFSPDGHPAIGYNGSGNVQYASFNGTNWQIAIADSRSGIYTSLVFTPDGKPAIGFHDSQDLYYAFSLSGNTWSNSIVDGASTSGMVGRFCSMAIGADGNPAISYRHDTGASPGAGAVRSLKFARFNGNTWNLSTIVSTADDVEYTSLAFAPDGQPAISYYDRDDNDLKLARRGLYSAPP